MVSWSMRTACATGEEGGEGGEISENKASATLVVSGQVNT